MSTVQERSIVVSTRMAQKFFDIRSKKSGQRNIEVHVGETELAALLALAFEKGVESARETVIVRLPPKAEVEKALHVGPPAPTVIREG